MPTNPFTSANQPALSPAERRVLLAVVVAFGLLGCAMVWTLLQERQVRAILSWVDHTQAVHRDLLRLDVAFQAAMSAKRGFVITGEPVYAAEWRQRIADQSALVEGLGHQLDDHPEQAARLAQLERLIARHQAWSTSVIDTARQQGLPAAIALMQGHEPQELPRTLEQLLGTMTFTEEALVIQRRTELDDARSVRIAASLITGFMAVSLCAAALVLLVRQLRARRAAEQAVRRAYDHLEVRVAERTRELSATQARLDHAQTIARLGSWELDPATGQSTWSAECFRLFGRDPAMKPPLLMEFMPTVHPEDQEPLLEALRRTEREGTPFILRFRTRDQEGTWRWYEARAHAHAPGGSPRLSGTVQDITERMAIEDDLRRLNQELEERVAARTAELNARNQQLETFTYSVSHDLKAPLRGIDGYGRLLEMEHAQHLNEEGRAFVATIRAATRQMGQLIDDLLVYSRLERRALALQEVDLGQLLQPLLDQARSDLAAHGGVLMAPPATVIVRADPESLRLALRNLLDNAVKFSTDAVVPEVQVRCAERGDVVEVTVGDNGIGFDMAYHDRIFEIFQRLNPAERYPGTGVGLAIVRKAMERLGGRVWATSSPGQGATFHLEIPR